jgi:hypothetical protein
MLSDAAEAFWQAFYNLRFVKCPVCGAAHDLPGEDTVLLETVCAACGEYFTAWAYPGNAQELELWFGLDLGIPSRQEWESMIRALGDRPRWCDHRNVVRYDADYICARCGRKM